MFAASGYTGHREHPGAVIYPAAYVSASPQALAPVAATLRGSRPQGCFRTGERHLFRRSLMCAAIALALGAAPP